MNLPAQPAAADVLLVRHGQTFTNIQEIFQGLGEGELTPLGLRQAEAVALRLAGWQPPITRVLSSPLRRAMQTAQRIALRLGLEATPEPELREMDLGLAEGHTVETFREAFPEHYEQWLDRANRLYTWPEGEQRLAFALRAAQALTALMERGPRERRAPSGRAQTPACGSEAMGASERPSPAALHNTLLRGASERPSPGAPHSALHTTLYSANGSRRVMASSSSTMPSPGRAGGVMQPFSGTSLCFKKTFSRRPACSSHS